MKKKLFYFFLFFGTLSWRSICQDYSQERASNLFSKVDSLIEYGIRNKAFPGAQVLVFKKDSIRLNKAYGFHTYDSITPVSKQDLYDLASVTKIIASTLAFMKLYELYDLNLDEKAYKFVPLLKNSNKRNSSFKQILSHSAGWIPYISHQNLVLNKKGKFKAKTISHKKNSRFPNALSENLFIHRTYKKKIFKRIKKSSLGPVGKMVYSGLIFFLIPQIVKDLSGLSFFEFLNFHFYHPMELKQLTFNPVINFSKKVIIPTERDTLFRKQLVHGWVHDEAAALMGGISGNAGLFANATSLAPILKMLLQDGKYNGRQYLKPETIKIFSQRSYPESLNPRGLGFDKPTLDLNDKNRYPSKMVSPETYGHTGYTGTMVWIDPTNECFVVFLSNRVYPFRSQRKLYSLNIIPQLLNYVIKY